MKHGRKPAATQRGRPSPCWRLAPLACASLMLAAGNPGLAFAQEVATLSGGGKPVAFEFDSNMLMRTGSRTVDLSRFVHGNPVLPGTYRSDVYLNSRWLGRHDVTLVAAANNKQSPAVVCLEARWIGRLSVDPQKLSTEARTLLGQHDGAQPPSKAPTCLPIAAVVEGATSAFDPSEQRLELTVPQAYVQRTARDYVPPESWTEGVTAATLNYTVNHQENRTATASTSQTYVGLAAGLSVGGWHLQHQGSLSRGSSGGTQYQRVTTNARHDLTDLKATLTLGDAYSDGQLFDSFAVRGVMLNSDDRMLPSTQRGFAPVIRGEARSQAKVQVRQNGALLHDITVPPGPFVIDDLYPTGLGADLVVTIIEADGSQHGFSIPFSPMPMLLREGRLRYSLVAGTLRNMPLSSTVAQGTVQYGLNNFVTLNGAAVAAENYTGVLGGAVINSPWGAWAADYTHSRLSTAGQPARVGGSLRASWSRMLDTGTNLSFASYRYSSEHYYNLQDANRELYLANQSGGVLGNATLRARNRVVATVSQSLNNYGSVYFTGASSSYWSTLPRSTTFQLGYSHRIGSVQFSLSAARETMGGGLYQPVNRFSVGVSMPLESQPGRTVQATALAQYDSANGTTQQASVSGSYGDDNRAGWGVYTTNARTGSNASASLNYRAPLVQVGAYLSSGSGGSSAAAFSASGGLVAHSGGITLAPYLGETIGLVKVENGEDVRILGGQAAPVDSNGYTVIPNLQPYQLNNVELDFSQAALDMQVDSTNLQAAPRARAVAPFIFTVPPGRVIFIKTVLSDGSPAPFGATLFNDVGEQVGAVGQAGKAEARVTEDTGRLTVKWGENDGQQCSVFYNAPVAGKAPGHLPMLIGRCSAQTERSLQQAGT